MTWDVWTVSKPCLVPMVVVRTSQAAGLRGGAESEGTVAARLHHLSPAAGELNSSRLMAAGEPVVVTARVEPSKQPRSGLSKCFRVSFAQVSHDEELSERIGQGVVNQQQGLVE